MPTTLVLGVVLAVGALTVTAVGALVLFGATVLLEWDVYR